jgi:hypothetical protein
VLVALAALAACGCELVIGTDEKLVDEAGAADDPPNAGDSSTADGASEAAAPDTSSCATCNAQADSCRAACAQSSTTCQSRCADNDNACIDKCTKTASMCVDSCTMPCTTCAQLAGCKDTTACRAPGPDS